jgi:hypothetical protein
MRIWDTTPNRIRVIVELATEPGRYGDRCVTALLPRAGWVVGKDRVQRLDSMLRTVPQGLKLPKRPRQAHGAVAADEVNSFTFCDHLAPIAFPPAHFLSLLLTRLGNK